MLPVNVSELLEVAIEIGTPKNPSSCGRKLLNSAVSSVPSSVSVPWTIIGPVDSGIHDNGVGSWSIKYQ